MNLKNFKDKTKEFLHHLDIERNVSAHTLRAYETDLKQFYDFWEQASVQEKINLTIRLALERYFVSLYHKKIDKTSIARKVSCFNSFERFCQGQGIKVSLHLTRPRLDKKLPIFLSVEEITHLLDVVAEHELATRYPYRDKAILELLYATGIRCSELVNIELQDISFSEQVIRIFGKGKKERIVLFGAKADKKIQEYIRLERPKSKSNEEKLFLNFMGQPISSRSIQRIVKKFCIFLKGNRPITPHKLRHTFATHMLKKGADLRIIQELLGHQALSSTEIYTHVSPTQLLEMADTIHPINKQKK